VAVPDDEVAGLTEAQITTAMANESRRLLTIDQMVNPTVARELSEGLELLDLLATQVAAEVASSVIAVYRARSEQEGGSTKRISAETLREGARRAAGRIKQVIYEALKADENYEPGLQLFFARRIFALGMAGLERELLAKHDPGASVTLSGEEFKEGIAEHVGQLDLAEVATRLMPAYGAQLAHGYLGAMQVSARPLADLEQILGLGPAAIDVPTVPGIFRDGLASIAYANQATWAILDAIHDAPSGKEWSDYNGASVPTHITRTNKGRGAVYVSMRDPSGAPQADTEVLPKLWQQVHAMSDLTSDAFLVCLAVGAGKREGPREPFWVTADAILDARGIKRIKRHGEPGNWQHGHRREDRFEAGRALAQLENAWLKIVDVEVIPGGKNRKAKRIQVESRALAILDRASQQEMDGNAVFLGARVAFGEWASEWWQLGLHQTALLAQKALEYDPYREQPEKRLTKYVAFHFRWQATRSEGRIRREVAGLVEAGGLVPDQRNPDRTRQRFEKALERLKADSVIADWGYNVETATLPARKWLSEWMRLTVWIEPPERVISHYLKRAAAAPAALPS